MKFVRACIAAAKKLKYEPSTGIFVAEIAMAPQRSGDFEGNFAERESDAMEEAVNEKNR